MDTREILTLQFGHYSNFIGAHWWNIQELAFTYSPGDFSEINNDVMYREGETLQRESTYTPRLLLADLKGSLKSLPEHGDLYEKVSNASEIEVPWHRDLVDVKTEQRIAKNEYQEDLDNAMKPTSLSSRKYNLDETVKVWSDFLYTRFHPRTVNVIKQYEHEKGEIGFDVFPLGTNLWKMKEFTEDFGDKIRNYIEECDNFQGFQIITDATNAFSGLSVGCIEEIKDEYEKKSVLVFPVLPSYYLDYSYTNDEELSSLQRKDSIRVLNLALCLEGLGEHSSLCVPLCTSKYGWRQPHQQRQFNHVNYSDKLPYHTSAILASALDTFTLKYRLKSTDCSLNDLCADFSTYGRKVAAASLCLPFSLNSGAYFIDCLNEWDGPISRSITPNCEIGTDWQMQLITLRGITEDRLKKPLEQNSRQQEMPAYKCNSINEMLSFYLSCTSFGTALNVLNITRGLRVGMPYPKIFDQYVGEDGNICSMSRPEHTYPKSVPTLAGLHSGSEIGDMLESLHTEAKKIKFPRFHEFTAAGLETDEFIECLDKLLNLRECYAADYVI